MVDSSDMIRRASRWAVLSVMVQIAKAIMLFGSQVVLARLLSPSDFGIVAMCAPVFGFLAIFNDLGLSQAAIQKPDLTRRDSSLIFWINIGIGLTIAALVMAIAPGAASFYGDDRVTAVLIAMSSLVVINSLAAQQVALMVRDVRPIPLLLIDIVPVLANVAVSISTAVFGWGYWSIVIGQATHGIVANVIAWTMSDFRPSWPRMTPDAGSMLRFGGHLTGLTMASFIAANLSPVIVGKLFGVVQVGLFDRAFKLVSMSYIQILTPITRIAETLLARLVGDAEQYRRAFLQISEAMLLVALPGLVCIAVQSEAAVELLYGPRWIASAPLVTWFALGSLMTPLGTAATWLFITQGRTSQMLKFGLVSHAISVVSLLVGIPWGTVGIATSFAVFSLPSQGLTIWAATRHGHVSLRDFASMLAPILIAVAASAAAVYAVSVTVHRFDNYPALEFSAGIVVAYVATVLALACFGSGRRVLRDSARIRDAFRGRRIDPVIQPVEQPLI
jgi:PST family polysaccharide transporter